MGNNLSSAEKDALAPSQAKTQTNSCPIISGAEANAVYNVLKDFQEKEVEESEPLYDRNSMPVGLRNRPMAGQLKPLPLERAQSTIPKGDSNDTWTYPSPQMFFNALKRKGKGSDIVEDDMAAVVHAHNTLNESTWRHVMNWERLHCQECPDPKLMKFCGRPDTPSPKARIYAFFDKKPFDRHDWVVDRCGKHIRYIIDFYFDESKAGETEAFIVDARPALDSFEAMLDRVKMPIYRVCARLGLPCPITGHSNTSQSQNITERV